MTRWLLSLLLLSATACASLESSARSEFARENSCPEGRVTVSHAPPRPAPPDVAADPQRLAVWNDTEAKRQTHFYMVTGCGRQNVYLCEHRYGDDFALPDCILQ